MKQQTKVMELSPLYMTEEEKQKLEQQLKALKEREQALLVKHKDAMDAILADSYHGNHRIFNSDIDLVRERIEAISRDLDRVQIIPKTNYYRRVNVGDILKLRCTFVDEEPEEMTIRLLSYVEGSKNRYKDGVMSISITSEMGTAIYGKFIGEIFSFGNGNVVEILDKILDPECVDIGDVVDLIHEEEGYYKEPITAMLVEELPKEKIDGIDYTSISSPMGAAIYGRKENEKISYQIGGINHSVSIQHKQKLEKLPSNYRNLTKN